MNRRWYLLLLSFLLLLPSLHAADEWLPVDKNDLTMKEYPGRPGSSAVILYRSRSLDSNKLESKVYYRIKILGEEGKRFANVQTDTMWGGSKIAEVKARTIQPDGTIVEFTGKPFEKVIASYKGYRITAQTFVLPDVRIGSIVEYMYRIQDVDDSGPRWMLEEEVFSREAHFYFMPSRYSYPLVSWQTFTVGNQMGVKPAVLKGGAYQLDLRDVEPLEKEPFMPPEPEVRSWIKFFYSRFSSLSVDEFWKAMFKLRAPYVDSLIDERSDVNREVLNLLASTDSPEAKLRKLYKRVQELRNLTYERRKEEKEAQRDKSKDNKTVNDVLLRGYGYDYELLRLFVSMARSAGLDAHVVLVAPRHERFFHREIRDSSQISDEVAYVKVGDKEYWLDPSLPWCPFGMLGWQDTDTEGLLIRNKETEWISTPKPGSAESKTQLEANLKLSVEGDATGTLTLILSGREALARRLGNRFTDDAERRKEAEAMVTAWLPSGAKVKVSDIGDFKSVGTPIVMTFDVEIPALASNTGSRLLLPASIFPGLYKNPFERRSRNLPIYVAYPWQSTDIINITLPTGAEVVALAPPRNQQTSIGAYNSLSTFDKQENKLQVRRSFRFDTTYLSNSLYENVWLLYDVAQKGDEEQAVLKIVEPR